MSTLRQKKAAQITLEMVGRPIKKTKGQILAEADYPLSMQKNPEKVFDSKGFIEELENFGLTEDLIKTSLVEDIKAKPKKRFFELSLGAEILGLKKQGQNGGNVNVQINVLNFGNHDSAQVQPKELPIGSPERD